MFKKGFTLVEILIAMALVGIMVAVITPNLTKMMPDRKKALFIKAYTRTEIAVSNMVNDPEMYPVKFDITNPGNGYEQFGLTWDEAPVGTYANNEHMNFSGDTKFCNFFAIEIGGSCDNDKNNIQTSDGLTYTIKRDVRKSVDPKAIAAIITLEFNGETIGGAGIEVKNDGSVSCAKTNDDCKKYLDDRYNFKKDVK